MVIRTRSKSYGNAKNIVNEMEYTPKSKLVLACKNRNSDKYDNFEVTELGNNDNRKTPTQNKLSALNDNDYSPVYIPCTQEAFDQLDVLWDWNSPQSNHKNKQNTGQKRTHRHHSPKLPIKKHPSNNQIKYDKLKTELEALQDQLVQGSCQKNSSKGKVLFSDKSEKNDENLRDLEDLFQDDSLEEEMILQSQKIEELFTMEIKNNPCGLSTIPLMCDNTRNSSPKLDFRKVKSDNNLTNSPNVTSNKRTISSTNIDTPKVFNTKIISPIKKCQKNVHEDLFQDDLFDMVFESSINTEINIVKRRNSDVFSMEKNCTEKLETHKLCNNDEIERKRLQALAKLKMKKQATSYLSRNNSRDIEHTNKQQTVTSSSSISRNNSSNIENTNKQQTITSSRSFSRNNSSNIECSNNHQIDKGEVSPIKCSPEEIEQKRLQALAKLEAKKKQDVIEKNRREALKRLEMNKKKRAMAFQILNNKK